MEWTFGRLVLAMLASVLALFGLFMLLTRAWFVCMVVLITAGVVCACLVALAHKDVRSREDELTDELANDDLWVDVRLPNTQHSSGVGGILTGEADDVWPRD